MSASVSMKPSDRNARTGEKNLSRQAKFLLNDYRDIPGPFDRIVSVGMFEHVGVGFYETFRSECPYRGKEPEPAGEIPAQRLSRHSRTFRPHRVGRHVRTCRRRFL